jgi:hypothetical protein
MAKQTQSAATRNMPAKVRVGGGPEGKNVRQDEGPKA